MHNMLVLLALLANTKADEAAVAKLPQQFADGYAARNGAQAASVFWDSPELVSIWPDKPSESTGIEAQRAKIAKDLSSSREIKLTFRNVHVTVAGDVAWGEARWDYHVVDDSGKTTDFHDGRYTYVARRFAKGGAWKIVAEHASLPYEEPRTLPVSTEGTPQTHAPIRPGRR